MSNTSYRELLKISEVLHNNPLIDNYQIYVVINPDDCDNKVWLKFVEWAKVEEPEHIYKAHNILPSGKYDYFKLDTYFDGLLSKEEITTLVILLDRLVEELPYMKNQITFNWVSSLIDFR